MQTLAATDANRHFSMVLKQVSQGEEFLVVSRGKPVATIAPVKKGDGSRRVARELLLQRLGSQQPETVAVTWSRDELYERRP